MVDPDVYLQGASRSVERENPLIPPEASDI